MSAIQIASGKDPPRAHRPRVLLVDPDEQRVRAAARVLWSRGYDVLAAPGSDAARDALTRETFVAVIAELRLYEGNGLEMVPAVRRLQPGIPVLVVLGVSTDHDRMEPRILSFSNHADTSLYDALTEACQARARRDVWRDRAVTAPYTYAHAG